MVFSSLSKTLIPLLHRFNKDYLILGLVSLLSFTWFPIDQLKLGGDTTVPVNGLKALIGAPIMWISANLGTANIALTRILDIQYVFYLLNSIGVSLSIAQHIYIFFTFFLSGASAYYLVSVLFPSYKSRRLIAFFAAMLYMFNPFLALAPFYAVLPSVFAFFVKGLREGKLRYAYYLTFAFFGISAIFPTYSTIILALSLLLFYATFHWVSKRSLSGLKFVITTSLLLFFANIWWILPTYSSLLTVQGASSQISLDLFTSANAQLPQVYRWLGEWAFYASFGSLSYAPWLQAYLGNPILIFITFIFPVLAFCSLLFRPKDKFVIFFSILSVILFFFAKGLNPPFGNLYFWFINVSVFAAFRDPLHFMYLITLGYSILIAVTCGSIIEKIQGRLNWTNSHKFSRIFSKRFKAYFVGFVLLALILVNSFYVVDGNFFVNWWDPPNRGVSVPQFYSQADNWLSEQPGDYRILMLPYHGEYVDYSWGYFGVDPTSDLILSKPLISGSTGYITSQYSSLIVNYVYTLFDNLSTTGYNATIASILGKTLGLLSVKFLIVDTSINPNFYGLPPINDTVNALNQLDWATPSEKFGSLLIYENSYYTPHIYAATHTELIDGDLGAMAQALVNKSSFDESALFLSDQNNILPNVNTASLSSQSALLVSYLSSNPTQYTVHISNSSEPFLLVFSESYDRNWVAYVDGQLVSNQSHFVVNGYGNAWYINRTGTFDVVLFFGPQRLFYDGVIFSMISISILSVSIIIVTKKKFSLKSKGNIQTR